jgi:hypothetical protein
VSPQLDPAAARTGVPDDVRDGFAERQRKRPFMI